MRLSLLLAVPLFLGFAQTEAHAQDLAACDLSALPDPASAYRDGNLQVDQMTVDAEKGRALFQLTGLPQCGYVLHVPPANEADRNAILANMPAVAAKVLHATAPLTVVANPITNGIPLEVWSGGTDSLFLITAQQLDGDRPYSADRGTLCMGATRLPVAYRLGVAVTPRAVEWGQVMKRLVGICMQKVPRDAASKAVTAALDDIIEDITAKDRRPTSPVGAIADPAMRARLNPRPAGWPALTGAAK